MEMKHIRGKNIIAAGYDAVDGILAVRFSKSGVYAYRGVPENIWVSLQRHPYPDKYVSQVLRGKYPVIKPEKETDGTGKDSGHGTIPDTSGPVRYGGTFDNHSYKTVAPSSQAGSQEEPRGEVLQDGRRNDGGSAGIRLRPGSDARGERVMEIFLAKDGLTFTEEDHRYMLNGQRLISLTQVLAESGLVDYSHVDPTVLANKAKFGTKVHEYCEWYCKGDLDVDDLKPYSNYYVRVLGWIQFLEDFDFIPNLEWCEVPAAIKVNGMTYGLTIDRFGIMGSGVSGTPAIVEIKTCFDREYHHQVQTAGQAIAFRGDGSVPLKRYAVYLLDKPNQANRYYFAQEHTDRNDEKVWLWALGLTTTRINHGLLKGYGK